MRIGQLTLVALAIVTSTVGIAAAQEDPHARHRSSMARPESPAELADIDLRDHTVLTQDGDEVRFVTDVIDDKIVVMDFVYTTCTTVCPVLTALLSQVQTRLGDRLGDDVVIVSITVDAIRDTPQRLKAYSTKHHAGDGWYWLTGPKPTMDDLLTGLGAYSANFEDHPSMVIVGDGRSGQWKRLFGFPNPDRIMKLVDEFQQSRESSD